MTNRRLSPSGAPTVNLPLLWLSFHYGALCYFTSGTEGPLVQLAAVATALFVIDPTSRRWQGVLALLPLVRPELALATAGGALWLWSQERRFPVFLVGTAAAISGGWILFRILYYADLFPNTFHLKNLSDPGQGLAYLGDALLPYHFPVLAAAALALLVLLARRGLASRLPERAFLLAVAVAISLWVVRIGGDARHYRYLAYPVCLSTCALAGVAEAAIATWIRRHRRVWASLTAVAIAALAAVGAPRQTDGHPILLREGPSTADGIDDAAHYRNHWGLPTLDPWSSEDPIETRPPRAEIRRALSARGYGRTKVGYVCWQLYRDSGRRAIHSLGLTEPFLARVDAPADRPGHKWRLIGLARDLAGVQRWWSAEPAPGMLRASVEAGVAPEWIGSNLDSLELIERKAYNRHRPIENLALAFTFVPRIPAPPAPDRGD